MIERAVRIATWDAPEEESPAPTAAPTSRRAALSNIRHAMPGTSPCQTASYIKTMPCEVGNIWPEHFRHAEQEPVTTGVEFIKVMEAKHRREDVLVARPGAHLTLTEEAAILKDLDYLS